MLGHKYLFNELKGRQAGEIIILAFKMNSEIIYFDELIAQFPEE